MGRLDSIQYVTSLLHGTSWSIRAVAIKSAVSDENGRKYDISKTSRLTAHDTYCSTLSEYSVLQARSYDRNFPVPWAHQRPLRVQGDLPQGRCAQPVFRKEEMPFVLAIYWLHRPRAHPELMVKKYDLVLEAADQAPDVRC